MGISSELIELIKIAQGRRSLTKFANDCEISVGNLSKILRKVNKNAPTAATLQKIANHSENRVTMEELMIAAGYLPGTVDKEKIRKQLTSEDRRLVENVVEKIKDDFLEDPNGFMFTDGTELSPEGLESFLDTLEVAIGLAKVKSKKKKSSIKSKKNTRKKLY